MLGAFKLFADVFGHGYFDVLFWIVPIDGQSVVSAAKQVNGYGVMLLEHIDQVGGVIGREELDSKVVYSNSEGGGKGIIFPKSRSIFHR